MNSVRVHMESAAKGRRSIGREPQYTSTGMQIRLRKTETILIACVKGCFQEPSDKPLIRRGCTFVGSIHDGQRNLGEPEVDCHQSQLNASLAQTLCRDQHLITAGSHANVLGEVDPTHHSRRVHQELCRPGDVMPVSPAAHVQQIVTAYHLRVWIGKKSESVTCLLA